MPTDHEEVGGGGTAELSESLLRTAGCRLEDRFVYLRQSFGQSQWSESDVLELVLDIWLLFQFLKAFGSSSAGVLNLRCLLESLKKLVKHTHAQVPPPKFGFSCLGRGRWHWYFLRVFQVILRQPGLKIQ